MCCFLCSIYLRLRLPLEEESFSMFLGMTMTHLMGQVMKKKTFNRSAQIEFVLSGETKLSLHIFINESCKQSFLSLARRARLYPRCRSCKRTHSSFEEAEGRLRVQGTCEKRIQTKKDFKTHFLVCCVFTSHCCIL